MTPRWCRALSAVALLGGLAGIALQVGGAAAAAPGDSTPAMQVVDTGSQITVQLTGWPGAANVSVSTCGAAAANGSSDCAVEAGTLLVTDAQGSATGTLRRTPPPVACPCVVRATKVPGTLVVTVPAPPQVAAAAPTLAASRPVVPDTATVSPPTIPPEPQLTGGRYLALVGAGGALVVFLLAGRLCRGRRRRARSAGPSAPVRDVLLLRVPAVICALAAVTIVTTLGYRAVSAGAATAQAQRSLAITLGQDWTTPTPGAAATGATGEVQQSPINADAASPDGTPFGLLRVPRWGKDYQVSLLQGVSQADLAKGPGHYPGSVMPGVVGNFALAGHRGPPGEPFNDIDALVAGDRLIVETAQSWFVYQVTDHAIVTPDRVDVVAPVPQHPGQIPTQALMTLTACHPRWSAEKRWVTWAELVESVPKSSGLPAPV